MLGQLVHGGWKPVNPTCYKDRRGRDVCLLSHSPLRLARLFMADVVEETRQRADAKVRELAGMAEKPEKWGEPWWEVVEAFLTSRRTTPLQGHILLQSIGSILPTRSTLRRWRFDTDGRCPCGGGMDEVEHRVHECSWYLPEALEEAGGSKGAPRPALDAELRDGRDMI